MSEVRFYHNAPDRLRVACVLAAKASAQGHRVGVLAADERLAQHFDELLWTWQPLSFVPHARAGTKLATRSAVLIGEHGTALNACDVWIKLDGELAADAALPPLLIEIVGQSDAERGPARARWARYKSQGLSLSAHDLGKAEA